MTESGDVFAFPASYAQQRLWFLDQVEGGRAVYNIPQAFLLEGPLDVEALSRALYEVVQRHESLRTVFESDEGSPLQVVSEKTSFDVPVTDLRELAEDRRFEEAARRCDAEARRAFDLEKDCLIRTELFQLGDNSFVLFLNVHHIVCDGWSLALLFQEVSALYGAFSANAPSPLAEQEIQYADYAIWQQETFEGEVLEQELGFWKEYLAGDLPLLSLPFDHQRPPTASLEGDLVRFSLSKTEADALHALAKAEKASLFQTLLAAFSTYLFRVTGEADVLVGSPIANRDREEIRDAIGFYTNTVVFRTKLATPDAELAAGGMSFRELLRASRDNVLSVLAHQEVPLEHVVTAVNPDRRTGDNPMFQVMFAVQQAPESALHLPNVAVSQVPVHSGTSKFDLLLEMQELSEGMQCFFEFATDLFERDTAERFVDHFKRLLLELVAHPDEPVATVALLDEASLEQVVTTWNATTAAYADDCLHEVVGRTAETHGDKVAVNVSGETLTYRELDERANQLAHHLRSLGVGPDAMVGVYTERSHDMMVGLLGAMKAGAAYLPLDPGFPADRIAYMIADAEVPVLLTQDDLTDELPEHQAKVLRLDADWASTIADLPKTAVDTSETTPDHLAYMIYTSGSTGKPKGVQIPHRAVVNFLASMAKTPGITADDTLLAVTTLSFDISVLELMLPLTTGATVCIATKEESVDGHDLKKRLEACEATVMQATPATWRMLMEAGWKGGTLKKVLCGGEAWPAGLARELTDRVDEVWNMYGPTETTIWSTCARVTDPDDVVIGKPIDNTTTLVLDRALQVVPPGVAGELLIGGHGLARGYHQRPELTADRFVDNPFGEGRLYHTGDLVKQRTDGSLVYLNRLDNQVKVRGYRIELGEIEAVLEKHEAVKQPVVIVWDAGGGDKRLAAYIVYEPGQSLTGSELRKFLRGDLPDYMIPHLFVEMETLPLTANNKVNRRALPDPLKKGQTDKSEFAAPVSDNEKLVAAVWKDVLKLETDVGLYDNFFDLGGHSLLSAQAVFKIEKESGYRLSPRAMVFQNVAQLAAELPADLAADEPAPKSAAESERATEATPASAARPAPAPLEKKRGLGWLVDKVKKRLS